MAPYDPTKNWTNELYKSDHPWHVSWQKKNESMKQNEKPLKRTKRNHLSTHTDDLIVVPRTSLEQSNFIPQRQAELIIPPPPAPVSLPPPSFIYPRPVQTTLSPSWPSLSVPHSYDNESQPQQLPSFPATVSQPLTDNHVFPRVRPAYLSPNPRTLVVYLLCLNQTSICFGCRRTLATRLQN